MEANTGGEFKWDELLRRIGRQNVIPVLGPGLFTVRTPDEGDVLLYPYLAKKFAEKTGLSTGEESSSFVDVVFRYLEKNSNDYLGVNDILRELFKGVYPVPEGPLWKLARIKSFPLFITTAHDEFLEQVLQGVRDYPTRAVYYTVSEKRKHRLDEQFFQEMKEGKRSLVYHIYGSAIHNVTPSYTEKDILESIVSLQEDMKLEMENPFFRELHTGSLLFIGCGYDDWLLRFFIRTVSNKAIMNKEFILSRIFINDTFKNFNAKQLNAFLSTFGSEAIIKSNSWNFVDLLFQQMSERYPDKIIEMNKFPKMVFISFLGRDRGAARRLAENLREDGITVWLDEWELRAGDAVDETIAKALSKCKIFIPIISEETQKLHNRAGKNINYITREWEWAYGQYTQGKNPPWIIPVKIDDTTWMYRNFEKFVYLSIPSGERGGEYKKLLYHLLEAGNLPQKTMIEIGEKGNIPSSTSNQYLKKGVYVPLNEVKLLILGDGGAGKTSLVKRLLENEFDENEERTTGININYWKLKVQKNATEIQIRIWDFGGQEILQSTHQLFLSQRSFYILVLDARTEEKHEYWFKYIETFGGNSPVLVVLNKIDSNPEFEVNRKYLNGKYKNITDFQRISCKTGEGIKNLIPKIENAILQVEFLKTKWESNWVNVKSRLENIKEPYISYRKYQGICIEEDIKEESSQTNLAELLNDLGIFLHYKDFLLEDTYVLNPRWVTEGIYAIINSKKVAMGKGIFNVGEVKEIFKNHSEYPPEKYRYIVDLMKKFQLCFEIDCDVILVPSLLQKEECTFEFDYKNSIKFVYQYDFLPKTVMPRFIVLRHKYIKGDLRWRTGVVLQMKDEDCTSTILVKLEEEDKKISIYITGDQKQFHLSKIRDTFKEIHDSYEKLEITEWVPLPDVPNVMVEYRELKGLKEMGKDELIIGKLKKEYEVSYLLDGIEKNEERTEKYSEDKRRDINIYGDHISFFEKEVKEMSNIKVGNVTTGKGDVIVAGSITGSFINKNDELNELFNALTESITKMTEHLSREKAEEVVGDLQTFKNEAQKEKPMKKWWELSAKGIKEAATAVGEVGVSVLKNLEKIIPILEKIS